MRSPEIAPVGVVGTGGTPAASVTLFVGASIGDESQGIRVPVSRDRAQPLRNALLANATGVRRF